MKLLAEVKEQVTAPVKHNKAEQQAKLDAEKTAGRAESGQRRGSDESGGSESSLASLKR